MGPPKRSRLETNDTGIERHVATPPAAVAQMNGLDRHQMFGALTLLVAALFVMSGLPGPWRRQLRAAAIGFFVVALVLALLEIALWLGGPGR